jgi:hypothetical protein
MRKQGLETFQEFIDHVIRLGIFQLARNNSSPTIVEQSLKRQEERGRLFHALYS